MINLTVTEAVLKMYDSGTVSPPAIVAQLIYAYPTLTIATARSIIENHRLRKNNPNAWKEPQLKIRPKSKADILQDNLHAKCRNCGYHQEGKPCVLPASMCPYEDMDAQMKELLDLRKKEASKPTNHSFWTISKIYLPEFDSNWRENIWLSQEKNFTINGHA